MSRWGVGPLLAVFSILYGGIMLVVDLSFAPVFRMEFLPQRLIQGTGIFFILIGIPFLLISVV